MYRVYSLNFIRETAHRHPAPDAGASVVKYRNAWEFGATGFRVTRGMTLNRRFLKKLNEYKRVICAANAGYAAPFFQRGTGFMAFSNIYENEAKAARV